MKSNRRPRELEEIPMKSGRKFLKVRRNSNEIQQKISRSRRVRMKSGRKPRESGEIQMKSGRKFWRVRRNPNEI
jgi:hypothetical protein